VDKSDPARMLAYNAYAALNNLLNDFWTAIKFANVEELNNQDQFVKTFFTGTPPAVTWKQIVGATNPGLYFLAGLLGFIKSVVSLSSSSNFVYSNKSTGRSCSCNWIDTCSFGRNKRSRYR